MTDFHVLIPARFASTRLPGKPLMDIGGQPMIEHVLARASESGARSVTVATDDERILSAVTKVGGAACLTSTDHQSGTDRIAEAARQLALSSEDIIVNVQGDEPEIPAALIRQVADLLDITANADMATACAPLDDIEQLQDANVVKVVRDKNNLALYFSRTPLPWQKTDDPVAETRRHIGIYAYRNRFLQSFSALPPCALEQTERLEQLRAMWHGYRIVCADAVAVPPPGVDSTADLEATRRRMATNIAD